MNRSEVMHANVLPKYTATITCTKRTQKSYKGNATHQWQGQKLQGQFKTR